VNQQAPYAFQWTIFDNDQVGLNDLSGQPQPPGLLPLSKTRYALS
jgi:hypothetical protein